MWIRWRWWRQRWGRSHGSLPPLTRTLPPRFSATTPWKANLMTRTHIHYLCVIPFIATLATDPSTHLYTIACTSAPTIFLASWYRRSPSQCGFSRVRVPAILKSQPHVATSKCKWGIRILPSSKLHLWFVVEFNRNSVTLPAQFHWAQCSIFR